MHAVNVNHHITNVHKVCKYASLYNNATAVAHGLQACVDTSSSPQASCYDTRQHDPTVTDLSVSVQLGQRPSQHCQHCYQVLTLTALH